MKSRAYIVLITKLCVVVVAVFFLKNLRFNYDVESFFLESDPDFRVYKKHKTAFGSENNFVLIGLSTETSVWDSTFLSKIHILTDSLENSPAIETVNSLTNIRYPYFDSFGNGTSILFVGNKDSSEVQKRILATPGIIGSLVSGDFRHLSLRLILKNDLSKSEKQNLIHEIRVLHTELDLPPPHLAGRIITQDHYTRKMKEDGQLFLALTGIFIFLFLWLSYKRWWGIVLPLLVVSASIIITLAGLYLAGLQMDLMMTMLPTILFVIGISDSIHFLTSFITELRQGHSKEEALRTTINEIGRATFLTSVTTVVGFLSLVFMDIPPITKFGVATSVGVMLTYLCTFAILPPALRLINTGTFEDTPNHETFWYRKLHHAFKWAFLYRWQIYALFTFLFISGILATMHLRTNNYFLDDLKKGSRLKQDLSFFENHFSGIRPLEFSIKIPQMTKGKIPFEQLEKIHQLDQFLISLDEIDFTYSPLNIIQITRSALRNAQINEIRVPEQSSTYQQVMRKVRQFRPLRKIHSALINDSCRTVRLMALSHDIGSEKGIVLNQKIQDFIKMLEGPDFQVQMTGAAILMDKNSAVISRNLVTGLAFALLTVSVLIGVLFRNFRITLLSLIPNVLPLIASGLVMYLMGGELKVSTALIFTISFGIAVDDTIHFLSRFQIESKNKSHMIALRRTFLNTGKSIVVTTLILISGFISFVFSSFQSISLIGILVSTSLLIAVIADLTLLPLILASMGKKK